jgi:hypothetical protein
MKRIVKKLSLNQETVRRLGDKELTEVQGGATLAACVSNRLTCTMDPGPDR